MSHVTDGLYRQYMEAKAAVEKAQAEIRNWERSINGNQQSIAQHQALMKEIEEALVKLGTTIASAAPRPAWPGGSKSL